VKQKILISKQILLEVSKIIREELILRSGCRIYPSNSHTLVFCFLLNYAKARIYGNGNEATEYKAKEYLIKILPYLPLRVRYRFEKNPQLSRLLVRSRAFAESGSRLLETTVTLLYK
jgi:hypothetical protein